MIYDDYVIMEYCFWTLNIIIICVAFMWSILVICLLRYAADTLSERHDKMFRMKTLQKRGYKFNWFERVRN